MLGTGKTQNLAIKFAEHCPGIREEPGRFCIGGNAPRLGAEWLHAQLPAPGDEDRKQCKHQCAKHDETCERERPREGFCMRAGPGEDRPRRIDRLASGDHERGAKAGLMGEHVRDEGGGEPKPRQRDQRRTQQCDRVLSHLKSPVVPAGSFLRLSAGSRGNCDALNTMRVTRASDRRWKNGKLRSGFRNAADHTQSILNR
jgi:hypothetical protein